MTEEILDEKLILEIPGVDHSEVPAEVREQLEPGDMLIKARSLHKSFLPEPWLSKLAEDSKFQRLIWRHKDPEDPETRGRVYGRNLHNSVNDGFIESYYRVFGGPENSPEQKLQTLIHARHESGDDIGFSKGFLKHKNKNGEIYRVISLEDSITYKPACSACKTQEVIKLEMTETELQDLIKKLQAELDDTKLQLEQKAETIDSLNSDKDELDKEKTEFTAKLEELEAKLEAKEEEKSALEETIVKVSDSFKEFKEQYEVEKKQPIIDEIFKLEKDDDLKPIYAGWDIEKLEGRLEKVKSKLEDPRIITMTLAQEEKDRYESEKVKDVGPRALDGWAPEYLKIMAEIEQQDRNMGFLPPKGE